MSTFADMVDKIASDIMRADLKSEIGTAINRAIRHYYNLNVFYFNETSATFSTVSGQKIYTPDNTAITDIAEMLVVKIALNASDNFILTPRTLQYIEQMDINNTLGQPFDYAYYNQNFYLYPIPNDVYTVTVFYNKTFTDMVGAQENTFTTQAEDLIEARARWSMYMHVIRNIESAQAAKAEEDDALLALRYSTAHKTSTGKVRPIQF